VAELAVLGSTSKITTGSLNQNAEGKLNQAESSLFAAFFQDLTLTDANQKQLPELAQDSVDVEEMLAELYSLMQPNGISLEEVVAKFEGLSTDKQQDISQQLAGILANQSNTVQAGQLKGLGLNDLKTPKINYNELTSLVKELGKQVNSNSLNYEVNLQNNFIFMQSGNSDLGAMSTVDLGNLSNNSDFGEEIVKFSNGDLATILKALLKSEKASINSSDGNTTPKLENSPAQEQKGYTSLIANLLNYSNNQSPALETNEMVEENNPIQKVNVEASDLAKAELQPMKMDAKSDLNGLEANKQANIEHLATNRNFTEELGKIMIKSFKLPDGASETKIQLHPQELGQIDVKLVANNGQISAQLITETALGKELLESQISQLKQSLTQQGYQVNRIEVQQAPPSSNLNNDFKGSSSFNFTGQNSSRQFARDNSNHKYSNFSEDVDEFVQDMLNVTGIDYTV